MIAVFKQKSPGNIIILLLMGLVIKLPLFIYPKNVVATDRDGQLYHGFIKMITPLGGNNALLASAIAFALIYIQALMLNYLVNAYRMTPKQTFLAGMAYMVLTSLLPEWNFLSSPLLAATLVIWMFILLFKLYNIQIARSTVYNIGLLAGIASYIFFPSAFFIICLLLGLVILKPFRINEIFLLLLGCLTPYYFNGAYLFLTDQFTVQNLFPRVSITAPDIKNSIWLAVSTLLLTVPFLLGGYYVQMHLRKMLIQVRKNWSILLFYLILAIFLPYVNNSETFHAWVLAIPPFAAFHASAYYYSNKNLVPSIIFFITIGFILYQQYGTANWQ